MDNFEENSFENQNEANNTEQENSNTDNSSVDFGYYNKSGIDIIQDNINTSSAENGGYSPEFIPTPKPQYTSQIPEKPKRTVSVATVIISVVLSAVISIVGCLTAVNLFGEKATDIFSGLIDDEQKSVENVSINIDEEASSIAQAVSRKCNNSVVGIRTTTSVSSFFGGSNEQTGEGSGVIYSKDGYIITNYHVIANAVTSASSSKVDVYLDSVSSKPRSAKVIGYNIASDLAIIKISASNLPAIEIGNSKNLKVGQYAITIGAPGGLEFMGSVTYGVISGLNRVVSSDSNIKLIQTDAAINPGNSGGALLDESGKLIGINSSKIVAEEFEGMGFAIPVNTVVDICDRIIANKDKAEPYIGITVSEKYTAEVLESYGFPRGAVVLSVADGSTAEECGIRRGDIITKFNGVEITEYDIFAKTLKKCKPGTTVVIQIYRSGRYYTADISVASNSYGN